MKARWLSVLPLLAASALTAAQEPRPRAPLPDDLRPVREHLLAELAEPVARSGTVETPGGPWECSRTLCSSTRLVSAATGVDLCRELRARSGRITEFRRAGSALSPAELRSCNDYIIDRAPGAVIFGDGLVGKRPPPAGSPAPGYRRAELRIAEVKPLGSGVVPPGGTLALEVRVENTGGAAADVALQVVDLSRGGARWSYTDEGAVSAGGSRSWRVELAATGSDASGKAFCGERTERLISLVEPAVPKPVPGYRPGTADAGGWVRFRDADEADNTRTIGIRFDCEAVVHVPPPRS